MPWPYVSRRICPRMVQPVIFKRLRVESTKLSSFFGSTFFYSKFIQVFRSFSFVFKSYLDLRFSFLFLSVQSSFSNIYELMFLQTGKIFTYFFDLFGQTASLFGQTASPPSLSIPLNLLARPHPAEIPWFQLGMQPHVPNGQISLHVSKDDLDTGSFYLHRMMSLSLLDMVVFSSD